MNVEVAVCNVIVDVAVIVDVIGPLIVAVHVHRNATLAVIARSQGPMSFVSMETTPSRSPIPWAYCSSQQERQPS
jgi:hypothetical protein